MKEELISIVIPVYNVENYIEYCLASVCLQTHKNLEIILINDGSQDKSGEICRKWQNFDSRIRYYEQQNKGPGRTRNRAIDLATGKYIYFLDADDCLEKDCLKEMHDCMELENSDVCGSNHYLFDEKTKEYTLVKSPLFDDVADPRNYYFPSLSWKMYKRCLFTDYAIKAPDAKLEDLAICPLLFMVSKKISFIDKGFYYYRRNIGDSRSDNIDFIYGYPEAIDWLILKSKEFGLWPQNKAIIKSIAEYQMNSGLQCAKVRGYIEDYHKANGIFEEYLADRFNVKIPIIWQIGSYNLSRITSFVVNGYELTGKNLKYFYGFSSIISMLCSSKIETEKGKALHSSPFRENILIKDIQKTMKDQQITRDDYLLIDFLEERNDLVRINQSIITKSEIYDECLLMKDNSQILDRFSEEVEKMWEFSIKKLVLFLMENFQPSHIILVENYLTKMRRYGNQLSDSWNEDVEKTNTLLNKYYEVFKAQLPGIKVISPKLELAYTDGDSKYGYAPYYQNVNSHRDIGERVKKYIELLEEKAIRSM